MINDLGGIRFFAEDPGSKKRGLLLALLVILTMTAAALLVNLVSERLIVRMRRKKTV